jgi:DHA2 family multidrug resistance protein
MSEFYLLSILLFTLSSFFCGIAPTLPILILFRVLQGLGGGGLQPTTQAILADLFPKEKVAVAFTLYSVVIVLAPTLGPVLGGWFSDHWGWRWIFFLNIPCGIAAYLLNRVLQPPAPKAHTREASVDYPGLISIALGLGCLEYVLDRGERSDWFASPAITTAAMVSCAALLFLVFHKLRRTKHPILQLRLLANRNFSSRVHHDLRYLLRPLCQHRTVAGVYSRDAGLHGDGKRFGALPGVLVFLLLLLLTTWSMKHIDYRALIVSGLRAHPRFGAVHTYLRRKPRAQNSTTVIKRPDGCAFIR